LTAVAACISCLLWASPDLNNSSLLGPSHDHGALSARGNGAGKINGIVFPPIAAGGLGSTPDLGDFDIHHSHILVAKLSIQTITSGTRFETAWKSKAVGKVDSPLHKSRPSAGTLPGWRAADNVEISPWS